MVTLGASSLEVDAVVVGTLTVQDGLALVGEEGDVAASCRMRASSR